MLYDRPSAAAKARRSRAKVIPHSHLDIPAYPDPATGRTWPPRGWSEAGIRNHEIRSNRVRAFLCAWGASDGVLSGCGRMSPNEARMRELHQFGRDPTAAAAVLEEATTVLLDLRGFARADTHPIPTSPDRARHHAPSPRPAEKHPAPRRPTSRPEAVS